MWKSPAARVAPVFPAETTASAVPSPTARHARTSELSVLDRTASTGFSCISIVSEASTSSRPFVSSPRGPKRIGLTRSEAASSAPSTTSSGPRSPPMASTATRTGSVNGLRRRGSERLDFAAAIRLARRTDAVRLLRLVADRAFVHAGRLQAMRGPPLVATGARLSALRDCHGRARSIATGRFSPRFRLLTQWGLVVGARWSFCGKDAGSVRSTDTGATEDAATGEQRGPTTQCLIALGAATEALPSRSPRFERPGPVCGHAIPTHSEGVKT